MRAVDVVRHPVLMLLLGCLGAVTLLGMFLSDSSAILGLLPANTLVANKYIWNLLTSAFYEKSILKLALDVVLLVFVIARSGLVVESYDQFGLYMVCCILAATVGSSAYCFTRFFTTGLEEMLLEVCEEGPVAVLVVVADVCSM
jgi:membrane associated rhomboid family serine protease